MFHVCNRCRKSMISNVPYYAHFQVHSVRTCLRALMFRTHNIVLILLSLKAQAALIGQNSQA